MRRNILLTLILAVLLGSTGAQAENPRLFFDRQDIPALKEKVSQAPYRDYWRKIYEKAAAYNDPQSQEYIDPQESVRQFAQTGWYNRQMTARLATLGFAYIISGEERFGRQVADIVASASRFYLNSETPDDTCVHGSLAIGYDWCSDAFSAEQKAVFLQAAQKTIDQKLEEVFLPETWWYPYHNWIGVEVGGVGLLALAIEADLPEKAERWIPQATKAIRVWLDNGFDNTGCALEGHGYAGFGLTNTVKFAEALRRYNGVDLLTYNNLARYFDYLALTLLPGESVYEARNDSNYDGLAYMEYLRIIGAQKSGLGQWLWEQTGAKPEENRDFPARATNGLSPFRVLWDHDIAAVHPEAWGVDKAKHFIGRGLCVWRTGWANDDIMYAIEAGPYYVVTHNQADKGHFTLYGHGYRWAIDSGYANNREPAGRGQTVAHNCILIDGQGQALSGAALGTNGKIVTYQDNEAYGYALADCTEAYNRNNFSMFHEKSDWWAGYDADKTIEPHRGVGVEHALRHSIFVKPSHGASAYAVVLDDIRKDDRLHEYRWQMLTWPDIAIQLDGDGGTFRPAEAQDAKAAPSLKVIVRTTNEVEYTQDIFTPGDHRKPQSFPRFMATTRAVNPRFVSLLLPLAARQSAPDIHFDRVGDADVIYIHWPQRVDVIRWPQSTGTTPAVTVAPIP